MNPLKFEAREASLGEPLSERSWIKEGNMFRNAKISPTTPGHASGERTRVAGAQEQAPTRLQYPTSLVKDRHWVGQVFNNVKGTYDIESFFRKSY